MTEILCQKLNNLKDAILNDERVLRLNEIEKKMNESDEVMKLAYQKDMMCIAYEDALKYFGENSKEALEAQKKLFEAKLSLDNHPLVVKYMNAYNEVKSLYGKINDELFSPITKRDLK